MKRPVFLITFAILLLVSILLGLNDTGISVADTGIPDTEITTSQTEAGNSSASATITITMYAVRDEYISQQISSLKRRLL